MAAAILRLSLHTTTPTTRPSAGLSRLDHSTGKVVVRVGPFFRGDQATSHAPQPPTESASTSVTETVNGSHATGSTSSSVLVELEYADLNLRDNYGVTQLGHVRIRQHVNPSPPPSPNRWRCQPGRRFSGTNVTPHGRHRKRY